MGCVCWGGKEGPSEVSSLANEYNAICRRGSRTAKKIKKNTGKCDGHERQARKGGKEHCDYFVRHTLRGILEVSHVVSYYSVLSTLLLSCCHGR